MIQYMVGGKYYCYIIDLSKFQDMTLSFGTAGDLRKLFQVRMQGKGAMKESLPNCSQLVLAIIEI